MIQCVTKKAFIYQIDRSRYNFQISSPGSPLLGETGQSLSVAARRHSPCNPTCRKEHGDRCRDFVAFKDSMLLDLQIETSEYEKAKSIPETRVSNGLLQHYCNTHGHDERC